MPSEIPDEEKRNIESRLYPTIDIQTVIVEPRPRWLAVGLGPDSRIPTAWPALAHAADAVQAARYHLYMALYERLYYQEFRDPPKPGTGNALAHFLFTSFSLHAVAAESHMAVSIAALCGIPGRASPSGDVYAPHSKEVYGGLRKVKNSFADLLEPFHRKNPDWAWLRKFRNRWAHMNPVRVAELGIQDSMDLQRQSFWEHDAQSATDYIPIGGGDAPETTIQDMLDTGVRCFNLLGKQVDLYMRELKAEIEKNWRGRIP